MVLSNAPLDGFSKQPPQLYRLPEDQKQIHRRHFMQAVTGIALGTAAISSYSKESNKEEPIANSQAPFFREGKDENGIIHYEHPSGMQKVSIMYTNHNQKIDPSLLPYGVTDLTYDTGGTNFQSGHHGRFFAENAPGHYKLLGEHVIDNNIELHLICPAAIGSENEDTTIPMAIDLSVTSFSAAIGALLMRDGCRDFLKDLKSRQKILECIQKDGLDDFMTWDIAKAGVGFLLLEPVAAAFSRRLQLGTLDRATELWLQSAYTRSPQLLPFRNRFPDLLHVIKLRKLMADRASNDPQRKQHFQLVIGKTHVNVASDLERPMTELLDELDHPVMQGIIQCMTSPPNLRTIPMSESSRFKKAANNNSRSAIQRVHKIFYPDLFDRLTSVQQKELFNLYISGNSSAEVIGAPEESRFDINTFLSGR